MAKIFSRDEYSHALRGVDEKKSLHVMAAEMYRNDVSASAGKRPITEDMTKGFCGSTHSDGHQSRRRAFRHLDAYAGQFF
jgi:hypothetical protein